MYRLTGINRELQRLKLYFIDTRICVKGCLSYGNNKAFSTMVLLLLWQTRDIKSKSRDNALVQI